ncbi:MAG: RNA polymerase subunit sigma-24 [Oscillospiraceae bacterium]|nr:RNA polymerase subunit sigma-24 [Oscillospiraceae bacterium]
MKNYRKSDYALNKYSSGIVYRFVDEIKEITLEDFLTDNPKNTEADFWMLKEISDEIFEREDDDTNATTKKNISITGMEQIITNSTELLLEEQYIENIDNKTAAEVFNQLIADGTLTEKQKRRLKMYVVYGMTIRQITKKDNVYPNAVEQSLAPIMNKLKKIF